MDDARSRRELISEIETLRRRLREDERRRLYGLLDRLPGLVHIKAPDFSIRYANRAFREIFGDVEGRTCYSVIHGRGEPCEVCPPLRTFRDGEAAEWECALGDGRTFQVYDYPIADADGSPLVLEMGMDITARKRAERKSAQQGTILEAFFEGATNPMALLDRDFNFVRVNRAYARAWRRDVSEFAGRNHFDIYPSDALAIFEDVVRTGVPFEAQARPFTFPDRPEWGVTYWDWALTPIKGAGQDVEFLVLSLEDVTGHEKALKALRESEEKYRRFMESANDAIMVADAETGVVLDANRKAGDLMGIPLGELVGMHQSELHPPEEREAYVESFRQDVERGSSGREFFVQRRDGRRVPVEISTSTMELGGRKVIQGIFRDITERRETDEKLGLMAARLRESEKMEAIGRFAGGIAHEFNNRLTAIMNFASVIKMKTPEGDPVREYMDHITESCKRASGLTQGLLAFSRKDEFAPQAVGLARFVAGLEREVRGVAHAGVEVEIAPDESGATVMADPVKLEDVLLNLARNASDAMPGGGRLLVRTGSATMDERFISERGFGKPGRYAFVSVSDTGTGMDEETLKKIFEPFFTTKQFGKGTGLGLAMSYGIVKQHGGYIDVSSRPGEGSTFTVYLPLAAPGEAREPGLRKDPAGGPETLLVAEDDGDVRRGLREMLEGSGYRVVEAADGEEAVGRLSADPSAIDLAILDVRMPGVGGREAYERMREIKPGLRVLFMSGYAGESAPGVSGRFVPKPFSREGLLRAVREALGG
ncbi:MAG: hypothetical protein Kow0025_00620 [Thermodesulfovibrionales bacterium]